MWKRKELKDKAKEVFKRRYWVMVLVALISVMVTGGGSSGGATGSISEAISNDMNQINSDHEENNDSEEYIEDTYSNDGIYGEDVSSILRSSRLDESKAAPALLNTKATDSSDEIQKTISVLILVCIFIVVFLIVFALCLLFSVFILNPLFVGTKRFFYKSLSEDAQIREVAFAFDHSYKNVIKVMFFKDLFTFLWSMLFLIPGIIKSYEYRMIPYILAEEPSLSRDEAFRMSRDMMQGQKWRVFVLDLSFIGWQALSFFTCGLLSVFYVNPYRLLTDAALYQGLRKDEDITNDDISYSYC